MQAATIKGEKREKSGTTGLGRLRKRGLVPPLGRGREPQKLLARGARRVTLRDSSGRALACDQRELNVEHGIQTRLSGEARGMLAIKVERLVHGDSGERAR